MRMPALALVVVLAVGASACGRTHTAEDGTYAFTLSEVLRDDCNLSTTAPVLAQGVLATTGNIVALDYAYLDIKLKGIYLSKEERMTFDGTAANVSAQVRGQSCLLDTVAMHIDASTQDATHFSGAMSIAFDARQRNECVCELWVKFVATKL